MTSAGIAWTLLAAALIAGAVAMWWQYGEAIALAQPGWMCLPR